MTPPLLPTELQALSQMEVSLLRGEHPGGRDVLVVRFSGTYRQGSEGNPDACFMHAWTTAAEKGFRPHALILDLSDVHYIWGDMLDRLFPVDAPRDHTFAMVVGPGCRTAISTLLYDDVDTSRDPCEEAWIFDTLTDAWDYVGNPPDSERLTALHVSARDGDIAQTRALLAAGADPKAQDASGETPVFRAATAEVVAALLDAGADANARNEFGSSPLHYAASGACTQALVLAGADPDARNCHDASPLATTQDPDVVAVLLSAGADPQLRRRTSLLHTVEHPDIARQLIAAGLNVNTLDERGNTPLDLAQKWHATFVRQAAVHPWSTAEAARRGAIVETLLAHGGRRASAVEAAAQTEGQGHQEPDARSGTILQNHYVDERLEAVRWACVKAAHDDTLSWDAALAVFAAASERWPPPDHRATSQTPPHSA